MRSNRGMTLVEVLVVITIIATLAGISVPLATSYIGNAREAACLNNLRALGVGLEGYLLDNGNIMPTLKMGRSSKFDEGPVLETVLLPYIRTPEAFRCPADKTEFAKSGSSYLWVFLVNGVPADMLTVFSMTSPEKIPLITDKEAWHPSGTNYLYADYSVSSKAR